MDTSDDDGGSEKSGNAAGMVRVMVMPCVPVMTERMTDCMVIILLMVISWC